MPPSSSGRRQIIGALTGLLIVLKGLPLAYAKDLQEDKEPVFDAVDSLTLCIAAMAGMIQTAEFDVERLRSAASRGFAGATDLADWLVRIAGIPFRRAHHITGALVKLAEARGCALEELPLAEMQAVERRISDDVYSVLGIGQSVASRISEGGTAPSLVKAAAAEARRRFLS